MACVHLLALLATLILIGSHLIPAVSSQANTTRNHPAAPDIEEPISPTVVTPRHPNNTDGFPKNGPTAKIHDQTNQTFANFQSTIANESELLATVVADIKDTIAKAKSKLTSIDSAKRDIEPIIVGIDGLSTTVDALYAAVSKRMIATLQNVGKFLNTTIASFVMVEWSNIGHWV